MGRQEDREASRLEAAARRQGRALAEAFDGALRRTEDEERSDRSTRFASGAEDARALAADVAPTEIARLQSQVTQLAEFRAAVLESRPWKVIQAARRVFGRSW